MGGHAEGGCWPQRRCALPANTTTPGAANEPDVCCWWMGKTRDGRVPETPLPGMQPLPSSTATQAIGGQAGVQAMPDTSAVRLQCPPKAMNSLGGGRHDPQPTDQPIMPVVGAHRSQRLAAVTGHPSPIRLVGASSAQRTPQAKQPPTWCQSSCLRRTVSVGLSPERSPVWHPAPTAAPPSPQPAQQIDDVPDLLPKCARPECSLWQPSSGN